MLFSLIFSMTSIPLICRIIKSSKTRLKLFENYKWFPRSQSPFHTLLCYLAVLSILRHFQPLAVPLMPCAFMFSKNLSKRSCACCLKQNFEFSPYLVSFISYYPLLLQLYFITTKSRYRKHEKASRKNGLLTGLKKQFPFLWIRWFRKKTQRSLRMKTTDSFLQKNKSAKSTW